MYWIIEHKKFVTFVVLAAILILIEYLFFIAGTLGETNILREEQQKLQSEIERKVRKGQFLSDRSILNAEEELKFLQNRYNLLRNKIHFKPSSAYQIPAIKRPGDLIVNFQSLLKDTIKRMEKMAAQRGVSVPAKLDLPLTNVPEETIRLYYEKLDIIEQAVTLAMESRCEKIIGWGVTDSDFKEFKDIKEPVFKTILATRNLVFIRFQGSFDSIGRFIKSLQNNERFISVERATLINTNPDSDSIQATFIVAVVKLAD
ncbi:MAG: hypothetical protein QME51_05070 [Planctomycetota bacterium]|nr:hypothetical protein [Planctomycetota bacterium]MDI6787722.1 hypothetical protein [Planctomycetota bacterium]